MPDLLGWIASIATMIAAMMTAANLGTRITGWGFVVFTIGSIAWATVGIMSGQTSLAITNAFLLLVNAFGVWRWLGRQAQHEEGSANAAARSRKRPHIPTLYSAGAMIGADVISKDGESGGTVVDAMMGCDDNCLSYVVLSQGGVGGVGEELRAISADHFCFDGNRLSCDLSKSAIVKIPTIDAENWPAAAPV